MIYHDYVINKVLCELLVDIDKSIKALPEEYDLNDTESMVFDLLHLYNDLKELVQEIIKSEKYVLLYDYKTYFLEYDFNQFLSYNFTFNYIEYKNIFEKYYVFC